MATLKDVQKNVEQYPDLKYVIDTVIQIIEFMSTDEMVKLKETSTDEYEAKIINKFEDFGEKQPALFNIILDGEIESLGNLIEMIRMICLMKTGQISMGTANEYVREMCAEQYIYPQFGGKNEFEKTIKERAKDKKHK